MSSGEPDRPRTDAEIAAAYLRRMVQEINLAKTRLDLRRALAEFNRTVERMLALAHEDAPRREG